MGNLTSGLIKQVEDYLIEQGMTFEPLRNELLDHFLTDIEKRMGKGESFETAFVHIQKQLAKHQLLTIEQETMEAISRQSTITTRFTYLGLSLLLFTTAFKLLHLPGTTILLFTSIGAFSMALLIGGITGIQKYKDKLGAGMLLAVIVSVMLHILAWALLILQLPGANPVRIISISALIVTFSVATFQFASNKNFSNSILSYLHEKYSPGIERVLLIVLAVATLLKIAAIVMGYPPNVGTVLLVFVISGGVLHFYASNWHAPISNAMIWLLIASFVIGILPSLGPIMPMNYRAGLASIFYISAGWIAIYRTDTSDIHKLAAGFVTIFYVFFTLGTWHVLSPFVMDYLFNPLVFFALLGILIMSWNHRLLKIFYITAIAHYLLEFPLDRTLIF